MPVEDWDALECVWRHSLCNVLLADPQEHPMLLVEPTFNSDDRREKMCEIAFEQFETPAVFLAKDSVLAAYDSTVYNVFHSSPLILRRHRQILVWTLHRSRGQLWRWRLVHRRRTRGLRIEDGYEAMRVRVRPHA